MPMKHKHRREHGKQKIEILLAFLKWLEKCQQDFYAQSF